MIYILTREDVFKRINISLNALKNQVKENGKLGYTDLNKHCEIFLKEVLNIIYDINLIDLNEERSNNPGLDLGDIERRVAYQITSNKRSSKINDTLRAITKQQQKKYDNFYILIIGDKQKKYKLDKILTKEFDFSEEQIIDFTILLKKIRGLSLEKLEIIEKLVKNNIIDIMCYLNELGARSSFLRNVEERPQYKFKNCKALIKYMQKKDGIKYSKEEKKEVTNCIKHYLKNLAKLPRDTREFYYILIDRSKCASKYNGLYIYEEKMRRFLTIPEEQFMWELKILEDAKLVNYFEEDDCTIIQPTIFPDLCELNLIVKYIKSKDKSLKKLIVDLDITLLEEERIL